MEGTWQMITYELNHECLSGDHALCATETYDVMRDGRFIGEVTYWIHLRVWTNDRRTDPSVGGYPTRDDAAESL
ncbi:hypothetical protein GCM10022214_78100 [Actinomadura miaoliensis]|uniref:Lipocalin-like domain-containing protein n=1 Tax=Actinomadura miaoliensis TaxID=430685 RepID=A0ABP7WZN0_9ACTN